MLERIADDKFNSEDEKIMFIDKYLKVSYYSPEISNIKKEQLQKII